MITTTRSIGSKIKEASERKKVTACIITVTANFSNITINLPVYKKAVFPAFAANSRILLCAYFSACPFTKSLTPVDILFSVADCGVVIT